MFMRPLTIIAASVIAAAGFGPALAAGDAPSGHQLALQWCSSCHIVDRSEKGPDTAPPFLAIARKHKANDGWVRAWLSTSHPPMPNFNLSRVQIDNIVAYLESFR
jgi:mono/diheme cytochrome c family protein